MLEKRRVVNGSVVCLLERRADVCCPVHRLLGAHEAEVLTAMRAMTISQRQQLASVARAMLRFSQSRP